MSTLLGTAYNKDQTAAQTASQGQRYIDNGISDSRPFADDNNAGLLQDTQYASFLREYNLGESGIQSSLQAAQEAAAQKIVQNRYQYDEQRRTSTDSINQGYENRQNRTGGRLLDLGHNAANIDRSQMGYEFDINQGKAQMERDAAGQIATMRQNLVEQQGAARERLSQGSILNPNG